MTASNAAEIRADDEGRQAAETHHMQLCDCPYNHRAVPRLYHAWRHGLLARRAEMQGPSPTEIARRREAAG